MQLENGYVYRWWECLPLVGMFTVGGNVYRWWECLPLVKMITVGTPGLGVRHPDGESPGWVQSTEHFKLTTISRENVKFHHPSSKACKTLVVLG
jgi:hypothetical protein